MNVDYARGGMVPDVGWEAVGVYVLDYARSVRWESAWLKRRCACVYVLSFPPAARPMALRSLVVSLGGVGAFEGLDCDIDSQG